MATTTIPWGDGSGDNITLTYASASGDQSVTVSSDANTGAARTKTVTFTAGLLTRTLTINQEAGLSGIPYIRGGSNGSYIDTGITADNTVKVIVWARNWNPTSGFIFGSREGTAVNTFGIGTHSTYNTGRIRVDFAQTNSTYANDQFANLSHYHKYELYQGVLKIDDVTIATATSGTFSNSYSIHLLGMNSAGTHSSMGLPVDICACKIYRGGTLVRDYTAVNTPSVGLYDSVSDTVFTNAGTGSFTYGSFNPNAYTPLEYISCTNAQYFDTGIYGYKALPVSVKFKIIGTSLNNHSIFGTMRSSTSGTYFLLQSGNSGYKNRYMNFYIDGTTSNQIYNNNSTKLTDLVVIFSKDATKARLVRNNAVFGTERTFTASDSFSTSPDTLGLGTIRNNGNLIKSSAMNGYIYYAGFGDERNYVPAKVNGVAGMYDTYNDVFKQSESGTDFIAGPEL